MAAGAGGASGGSLESSLERRFRGVSNTMDSIQGLSSWCIENKKYHSLIVRHWMKCLRKSVDTSHRQNLFYVANDVIQNCKRKNAIVYRTAFAEMLPDAFLLVNNEGDLKVIKSVERILSIWEDRGVYSGTLINELRSTLVKEESPPETPVEQKTPVESKADLQSKIVAEFVPQALFDQLSRYKKSLEEVDLREKQLAAMRIDIGSTNALKRLKDKAGGKKFSKDFEEGSAQLQEFVKFFDRQVKMGPPLMEALSNADIFYEMQYKEVKIVANAYQTFANRVSHLKRKLDALKANLPDLDDSPIPSPSADAPSPTGSESPFHGMDLANPDPDLDGCAMDDEAEPPAPSPLSSPGGSPKHNEALGEDDNREVEDMELSEEEMDGSCIIVEEQIESPVRPKLPTSKAESPLVKEKPVKPPVAPPASLPVAPPASLPVAPPASLPVAPPASLPVAPPASLPVASPAAAVESVDLGKIGSILSSLNSVMKNSAPPVESPPPVVPVAPVVPPASSSLKTPPAVSLAAPDAGSLVNLLSKVDVCPADLLSALSRVKGQGSLEGISSLLSSPAATPSSESDPAKLPASSTSVPSQSLSLTSVTPVVSSQSSQASIQTPNPASALVQALHRDMDLITETEPSSSSESLESKIHSFLQGNPAFNMFSMDPPTNPVPRGDNLSPLTGADTQVGTPVRDEGGGTPTQDEIMDKHTAVPFSSNQSSVGVGEADVYQDGRQNRTDSQGTALNGQVYQPYLYGNHAMPEHQAGAGGVAASAGHYQQTTGGRAPGSSTQVAQRVQNEQGWYSDAYPEGTSQLPGGYSVAAPGGGGGEHSTSGLYSYQAETFQEPRDLASQHGAALFRSTLPPVPQLPPPPHVYDAPPPAMMERHQPGGGPDSAIGGVVVHDHQHKSMFHPGDSQFDRPRPEDMRYQDEPCHGNATFYHDEPYHHPDDGYYRSSPPHHPPRGQGCLSPPVSSNEDPFYDYQRHPAPHYAPRRPPPPRFEMRHPHPPHRPPRPAHHPRGPPPFPRFHGPDPRLRGKRPGPRGGGYPGPMFPPKRPFLPPRY